MFMCLAPCVYEGMDNPGGNRLTFHRYGIEGGVKPWIEMTSWGAERMAIEVRVYLTLSVGEDR